MPEQNSSRDFLLTFQPYASTQRGTSANSAALLYKQEKKNPDMCNKFNSFHLITPHCQKGSGFGCVIPAPRLADYEQGQGTY